MIYAKNKKAYFNYEIIEKIEVGISLHGTEVKSIKKGNVSIKEAFVRIIKDEAFIFQMNISSYEEGNINNVAPNRERKLLLHKKEILKFKSEIKENRYSLVPLTVYLSRNKIKLELALARGKKMYDKRESIKRRDVKREIEKNLKKWYTKIMGAFGFDSISKVLIASKREL